MARILLLLLCLLSAWPGSVSAGSDQDEARAALERGEIKPLDQVLAAVRAAVPGDVVAVKLKSKKKAWIYSLKVLTPAGKRRDVKIDAGSLSILDADDDDDD